MKPKYWAIVILAVLATAASLIYYINRPALDLGPIIINHKIKNETVSQDWKVFKNDKYEFEISFPGDWEAEESKPRYIEEMMSVTFKPLDKNNKIYFKLEITNVGLMFPAFPGVLVPFKTLQHGGYYYNFWSESQSDTTIVKIFDSFRFVNYATDPSTWKTYTNNEYGFEVKYPPFENANEVKVEQEALMEATLIVFQNYSFEIYHNKKHLSLNEWFLQMIDPEHILIDNGTYELKDFQNSTAWVYTNAGMPPEYTEKYGPVMTTFFTISPYNGYIIGFSIHGQDNNLDTYGYTSDGGYERLENAILSTFKFIK